MLAFSRITPRQVAVRLAHGASIAYVDARTDGAFDAAQWKLPGAVHASCATLVEDAARVSRSDLVVVYGADEHDAEVPCVAEGLRALGFGEVRILSGGLAAWSELRYAVHPARAFAA